MDAVIVAIITAGVSLIGTIITVLAANKSTIAAMSEQSKVADERIQGQIIGIQHDIQTLTNKVEKHNKVIERTYNLEGRVKVLEAKGGISA